MDATQQHEQDPGADLCAWPLIFHGYPVRSLIDERDKSFWAYSGDIGRVLGYGNVRDALTRVKSTWQRYCRFNDSMGRSRDMLFINEQAIFKLAFRSDKDEADEFTDRVSELLTKLRRGELVLRPRAQAILAHTSERQQKDNSITYNRDKYMEGGEEELRKRNGLLCVALSDKGIGPKQYQRWAQSLGMPAKDRTSGQQVLRRVEAWSACACSAAKNYMQLGMPWEEAIKVALDLKTVYKRLLPYATPKELADHDAA